MTFADLQNAIAEHGDCAMGGSASHLAISDAERSLHVTFPEPLREYLGRFGNIVLGHMELFGLGPGVPAFLNIVSLTESERAQGGLPKGLIPLLNDGAGNLYCVDAKSSRGRVVFWDHELGPEQQAVECATTLEEWIWNRLSLLDKP